MLKLILLLSAAIGVALFACGASLLSSLATSAAVAALATVLLIGLLWLNGDR